MSEIINPEVYGSKRAAAATTSEAENALGKLAYRLAARLKRYGWQRLVTETRGRSNIAEDVGDLSHRAAGLLRHLGKRGASVPTSTAPWTRTQCSGARINHLKGNGSLSRKKCWISVIKDTGLSFPTTWPSSTSKVCASRRLAWFLSATAAQGLLLTTRSLA